MSKFIEKTIENSNGGSAGAWVGGDLQVNVAANTAIVRMRGWKTGQYIADKKGNSVPPIVWKETDMQALATTANHSAGVSLLDIVFDELVKRMLTLDDKPDGSGPNPFKDGVLKDVPAPAQP